MATQQLLLALLVFVFADGYRMKRKNSAHTRATPSEKVDTEKKIDNDEALAVGLHDRSEQKESLLEASISLERSTVNKGGGPRRRDNRRRHSKNGWCLPHQKCTYNDCCSWGTSCNTCPAGYRGEKAFGRCALKGHHVCKTLDCISEWGAWSACSAECGGGTQTRNLVVEQEGSTGGRACPSVRQETQQCNTHACAVDCVGKWGDYGECSEECGAGTQTRTYKVLTQAQHGGASCEEDDGQIQEKSCKLKDCAIDCQGAWSDYTACSATCGEGEQTRKYFITTPKLGAGHECPAAHGDSETKACNVQECCPAKTWAHDGDCIDQTMDNWWKHNKKVAKECCEQGAQLG